MVGGLCTTKATSRKTYRKSGHHLDPFYDHFYPVETKVGQRRSQSCALAVARNTAPIPLGPEPLIGRQEVVLQSASQAAQALRIATDGARPFTVQPLNP